LNGDGGVGEGLVHKIVREGQGIILLCNSFIRTQVRLSFDAKVAGRNRLTQAPASRMSKSIYSTCRGGCR